MADSEAYLELNKLAQSNNYDELNYTKLATLLKIFENDSDLANDLIQKFLNEKLLEQASKILAKKLSERTPDPLINLTISRLKLLLNYHFHSENRQRRILENVITEISEKFELCAIESKYEKPKKFEIIDIVNDVTKNEIHSNIIQGPYESLDHYLRIQKLLIIEDFMKPLKSAIDDLKSRKIPNPQILHSYGIGNLEKSSIDRIWIKISDVSSRIDWLATSRLIYGSMVLLDNHGCLTFWTVNERNTKPGQVLEISLSPLTYNQDWSFQNVHVYESIIYFEAYKHVIQALSSLRQVPFKDQLVYLNKDLKCKFVTDLKIRKPSKNQIYSSSDVIKSLLIQEDNIFEPLDLKKIKVNDSQLEALKIGLENKIALIQGPPGTGKSYVGIILAQILISNLTRNRPLVVVCYTNHALDTFMEGLINFTSKIIRIGGRSKSAKLEPYNLSSLKKHLADSGSRDKRIYRLVVDKNQIFYKIKLFIISFFFL